MNLSRQLVLFTGIALGVNACRLQENDGTGVAVVPSLSSATMRAGDTVRVSTIITNTGRIDVRIDSNDCNRHFEVLDASGEVVGPAEGIGCFAIFAPVTLAPGASYTLEGFYTGIKYEPLRDPVPGQKFYVPAGKYTIRGRVAVESLRRTVVGRSVALTVRPSP